MHLITLGLNHKTASIGLREKLAVNQGSVTETIGEIMHYADVNAAVLVSTCNRTEIYLEASSLTSVLYWLKRQHKIKASDLEQYTYLYFDQDAVTHLMQVACGLDSMVLGEVEILGQLKIAYQTACNHGYVSKSLGRLFETAFSVAKKVRTQTDIGLNPVSVAYLAVRLAERIFAQISEQNALIIGAGDTAKLLLKHLYSAGVKKFFIANRSIERSQALVSVLGLNCCIELIELGMIPDYLAQADIVVTATASPLPIVGKGMVEGAIKARRHKPMFMIDLAVPRDIEPQVREISDVYLYGIDDLQSIAAEHKRYRHNAALKAELIIKEEAENFISWMQSQHAVSTINAFRQSLEAQRDKALDEAVRQLNAGKDAKQVLQRFAHVMLNRILHQPTVQMRKASTSGNIEYLKLVRSLYDINTEEEFKEESLSEL
jgi:glutamyl-tRNA reductase